MKKSEYDLCPKSKNCYAINIRDSIGNIEDSNNILTSGKGSVKLRYIVGGVKPKLILDMGSNAPGGYPIFTVQSQKNEPTLRISYSDRYEYIIDEKHGENGDFIRGCCKYLGVELPVLPGNPNRFELYNIKRNGKYMYPLIQGQQRFVLITLDTPGTEVTINDFHIIYTGNMDAINGAFQCSNENLNKLWYSSVYTAQIATINNSQSLEKIDDYLAIRMLTKGKDISYYKGGATWKDYTVEARVQIATNPRASSGIGMIVRADIKKDSGYVFSLELDGSLRRYIRQKGINHEIYPAIKLPFKVVDNVPYRLKAVVNCSTVSIWIDDAKIITDDIFAELSKNEYILSEAKSKDNVLRGTIGFVQTVEKWALAEEMTVTIDDEIIYHTLFDDLDEWEFTKSLPFVADGAKRDRLPWLGDLDWAGRNIYYAFKKYDAMPNTLRIFAEHQTPEGYIWATCYPENIISPHAGEYGYYESDIFSAWFLPTLADYLLFTEDIEFAREMYPAMNADLDYLWKYVEADGLFTQRYATSKGLWDHTLSEDIGKYTYHNIIIQDAFEEGSRIAKYLDDNDRSQELGEKANIMRQAIIEKFWNDKQGFFVKSLYDGGFCAMSNAIGLAKHMVTNVQAEKLINNYKKWLKENASDGKIISLFIRGCFEYGYDDDAFQMLLGKTGIIGSKDINGNYLGVDWITSINDTNGPATTIECQYHHGNTKLTSNGRQWGDCSHPDTAVAHLLTGYILGVEPVMPGFKKFKVNPHMHNLDFANGIVPTPYGDIRISIQKEKGKNRVNLDYPENIILEKQSSSIVD